MSRSKLFFLIVFILISCGKSEETPTVETYTVETIDGVKHVHNHAPLWGDNPLISLELSMILGVDETKGDDYLFYYPWDVKKDKEGNIYIFSRTEYNVRKFDPLGNYLKTFGRSGQGPGEFSRVPGYFCLDNEGNLYVMHKITASRRRVIVFNPEGKEIKRFEFEEREYKNILMFGFMSLKDCLLNESNQFVHNINVPTKGYRSSEDELPSSSRFGPEWFDKNYIRMYDIDGRFIREFGIESFEIHVENSFARFTINDIVCAIDNESNIYVTFKFQNRIEKYSPEGKLLMRIDRKKGFEQIKKFKDKDQKKLNVFSTGIGIDSKNRIWIASLSRELTDKEFLAQNEIPGVFQFEVYNTDGILLCVIPCGYYVSSNIKPGVCTYIYGDKLYTLDRITRMCLYEYKIIEK